MGANADDIFSSLVDNTPDDAPEMQMPADPAAAPEPEPAAPAAAAPEAAPAAEPAAPAPAAEPAGKEPEGSRTIPLAAHLEERNRLKSRIEQLEGLARQNDETRSQIQKLEAELAALKNPPKPPEPDPDFSEDPKAYIDRQNAKVIEAVRNLEKMGTEQITAQSEQLAQVQLANAVVASEAAFEAATPDYGDARMFFRNLRAQQLALIPGATEQAIVQQIYAEERQMAAAALQRSINPAQYLYNLAKASGYAPRAPTPAAKAATPPATPPAAAPAAAPALDKEALRGMGSTGGDVQVPDEDDTDGDPIKALEAVHKAFLRR